MSTDYLALAEHEWRNAHLSREALVTLALAQELRTANLIAVVSAKYANGSQVCAGYMDRAVLQIMDRLGFDDTTEVSR